MKGFVVIHRMFLALAVCAIIGVGGATLAHHTGQGHVKVTQLSQRDIVEKLDGKDASATVVEVTPRTREGVLGGRRRLAVLCDELDGTVE